MHAKGGPAIVACPGTDSCPDWIELDVRSGDRHLLFCGDWNASVALLEQLAAGSPPSIPGLSVGLRKALNETSKLDAFSRGNNEMHMVAHLRCGVNRHPLLLAGFAESKEKESVLARIREEPAPVVAAEDDVVWVPGQHLKGSWLTRHVAIVGQRITELRFRGWVCNVSLTLGFSGGSMSP